MTSLLMLMLALLAACGGRGDAALTVRDAWARPASSQTPPRVSAVYLTLENRGATGVMLTGVASDAARAAEIHESRIENEIARMRPVGTLEIPTDDRFVLQPGGHHIMLVELRRDLNPGDVIQITLTFESGTTMVVDVPVMQR